MAESMSLAELRREAASCQSCPLYRNATQTVFGEGPAPASMMLVGEQPGDQEDLDGRPFVGPAGQVLDRALVAAGIDRSAVYVTNAVKHFKFTPRGKRRLHQKPDAGEIAACHTWLLAELETVGPGQDRRPRRHGRPRAAGPFGDDRARARAAAGARHPDARSS